MKWFRLSAAQGNAQGQGFLGFMLKKGRGVLQDYKEAAKWFRLSAEQGDAEAQNNLSIMYHKGLGVLQDNVRAHMWVNIAAVNGSDDASKNRDIIAAKMTTEDISKAQSMARECMESNYKNCGY